MLDLARRGFGGRAAWLAALVLVVSGCALSQEQSQAPSPAASPSPPASPPPLKITSATFHSGEVGIAYAPVTVNGIGGVTPYSWSISTGAMPSGLTISSNGTIAGTPKAAGTFHFTLQLSDAGGSSVKMVRSFAIVRALKASLISTCAVQCLVEIGCVSVCGKFGALSGGIGPYTYSSLGNIPSGVQLSGLGLTGTFTTGGPRYYTFTVNVTDSLGAHTSISPTFNVFPHLTLSGGLPCAAHRTCSATLLYTVGVSETPAVRVVAWTGGKTCGAGGQSICTAPHFSASVQGGVLSVTLGPSVVPNLTGTFRLSLSDQFPCGSGVNCSTTASLTVNLIYP